MPHDYPQPLATADLMAAAARRLRERAADTATLHELLGPPPEAFQIPAYGTPSYVLAMRCAWISTE